MKYQRSETIDPTAAPRIGVLLVNLGTPDAPERGALRRYLKQFLSDPRVVELPRAIWWPILNGVILNLRPGRSAKAYKKVWMEEGSPLLVHTRAQADALRETLQERFGDDLLVEFAMRYGSPSMDSTIEGMLDQGVSRLLVFPLYPQYSGAATGSVFDALTACLQRRRDVPALRTIRDYHDHADYIGALALQIRDYRAQHGSAEKLLFSYHGTPQRQSDEGDPYFLQCQHTTRLVAELLDLPDNSFLTCFQSRFGREPWLLPATDTTLRELAAGGTKSVQVICPGFSSDCLETLEEIAMENRDYFLEAGGENYSYIPCLNSEAKHIAALAQIAGEELVGWVFNRLE